MSRVRPSPLAPVHLFTIMAFWPGGRVVRQRSAKPRTRVQIPARPPKRIERIFFWIENWKLVNEKCTKGATRVSYSGYYTSLPRMRYGFDSRYPLQNKNITKVVFLFWSWSNAELSDSRRALRSWKRSRVTRSIKKASTSVVAFFITKSIVCKYSIHSILRHISSYDDMCLRIGE